MRTETIKELKKLVGLFEHRKVYTNDDLEKLIKLINNL